MSDIFSESSDLTAGPQGAKGTGYQGSAGADGVNAYTKVLSAFTQPAADSSVTVQVVNSDWMGIGQGIYVETGGYYYVLSTPSSTSVTLKNIGYSSNAASGSVIPATSKVSPGGSGFIELSEVLAEITSATNSTVDSIGNLDSTASESAAAAATSEANAAQSATNAAASATAAAETFYKLPVVSITADKTLALTDRGSVQYHAAADTTARAVTIPLNSAVAFDVGTSIPFDNIYGAGAITLTPTSGVTLQAASTTNNAGSVVIASGGNALLIQVATNVWRVSGVGLTATAV